MMKCFDTNTYLNKHSSCANKIYIYSVWTAKPGNHIVQQMDKGPTIKDQDMTMIFDYHYGHYNAAKLSSTK